MCPNSLGGHVTRVSYMVLSSKKKRFVLISKIPKILEIFKILEKSVG